MSGTPIREFEDLATDLEPELIFESDGGRRAIRIAVLRQEPVGFAMCDDHQIAADGLSATNMIGVMVAVNDVGNWFVAELGNGAGNLRRIVRRDVDEHYAIFIDHEHRLVCAIGDQVKTVPELLRPIPFRGINRRAFRRLRYIEISVNPDANRRE